jgi:hypothetical protein
VGLSAATWFAALVIWRLHNGRSRASGRRHSPPGRAGVVTVGRDCAVDPLVANGTEHLRQPGVADFRHFAITGRGAACFRPA